MKPASDLPTIDKPEKDKYTGYDGRSDTGG